MVRRFLDNFRWYVLIVSLSLSLCVVVEVFFFFKQKTAYEMRISDWSSDVCPADLLHARVGEGVGLHFLARHAPVGIEVEQQRLARGLRGGQLAVEVFAGLDRAERELRLRLPTAEAGQRLHRVAASGQRAEQFGRADYRQQQPGEAGEPARSEEHTSELQSLMRISYAVFC